MIYWAPLLHFYQPTTQLHWVLKKVCNESYRPLVNLFHELPYAEVTVNVNAVLTELLDEHGMSDVIDGLRELAEKGRLEFTGSAKYHPILPLIPEEEMLRQIVHNHQTNRRFFGRTYSPQGFFSPEMCYSRDIVKPTLDDTGHRWLVEHFHGRYPSWQSIPLWKSKDNLIHQLQWQHLTIAIELAKKAAEVATTESGKYYADFERR